MALQLTYAPTPPRDGAEVVRSEDGFVLTIPARLSWEFAIGAVIGTPVALLLLIKAVWPLSGSGLLGPTPILMRIFFGGFGLYVGYVVFKQFIVSRSGWAVLTVRNDRMIVTKRGLFGSTTGEYWLIHYKDARTDCSKDMGSLTLVGTDGTENVLLTGSMYRRADLRFAAKVLRDSIKTLDAEYARQQVAVTVALQDLAEASAKTKIVDETARR
jgi:hypothetical protein